MPWDAGALVPSSEGKRSVGRGVGIAKGSFLSIYSNIEILYSNKSQFKLTFENAVAFGIFLVVGMNIPFEDNYTPPDLSLSLSY